MAKIPGYVRAKTRPPYAAEFVAPMIEWVEGGRRCELSLELGGLAQTIPDGAKSSGGMMDLQCRTQITQVSWRTKAFAQITSFG